MKRKKRKVGKGFKFFAIMLTLFSLMLIGMLVYINVLSNLLLGIAIGVILLIDGLVCFLLLKSRKKKIGLFISTILMIIYSLLGYYLYKTTDFLSNLNFDYKTYNYSVVVLKDSEYEKLKDITNKELGYYDEETSQATKSLEKLTDKIELNVNPYDNTHDMAVSLIDKKMDAILIEDSHLDVITINDVVLAEQVKKIYSFSVRIKTDDMSKDLNVTKEPFNIYVSGIDTYGEITSVSRSDVNMVVTVNPTTKQILLTSIPRDYYVPLHGKTGYPDKLTHAGMYGTEMSIKTIEDLLDIEINYYVKVNFTSVIDIVDAIGGVNIYSDYTFTSRDNYKYQEGYNQVDGEKALSFARERKAFAAGDRQRVRNQQALLQAIFEKCTSKSIITKYTKLLDSFSGSFVTNMKMNRLTSLVKLQLTKNYSWEIISNSLNGTDGSNYTFSAPNTKAYVMEPVEESVDYASELIKNVMQNTKLDKEEVESNQVKINGVVASQSSSSNKTTTDENKKENSTNNANDEEVTGLNARLVKSSIEITKGDDYIYNGVTAKYNNKDVTNDTNLKVTFKVGSKIISDYQELILYVSKLESGNYGIIHNLDYNGETVSLTQYLKIKEPVNVDVEDDTEDIPSTNLPEEIFPTDTPENTE